MNSSHDVSDMQRKIRILYADDRPENVQSLLQGVQAASLLPEDLAEKLILHQLDLDENMQHNHELLRHPEALVEIDYATLMEKAISKVRDSQEPYDLIISDWYFGEYDPDFKDSQIGGIWIMLWGKTRHEKYKPICKLYTAQQTQKQQRIDFVLAKEYIQNAFGIHISEIRKSETADSWQDHLETYLIEVAQQILPYVNKTDIVGVINLISDRLAFSRFHNSIQDNAFESFRKKLLSLNDFTLKLTEGKAIKLSHLFPLLIGRYSHYQNQASFAKMSPEEIAALLYARRLIFLQRDERDEKAERLQQTGIEYEEFKDHDGAGNPLYGIQVKSADYYEGPLTALANLLTQSLDFTFKVQSFYLNERGLGQWLHAHKKPFNQETFNVVRQEIILPDFKKIKPCFDKSPVAQDGELSGFGEQIAKLLKTVTLEDLRREDKDCPEKNLTEKFARLQKQPLFDDNTRKLAVPLKSLFRINVHDFLTEAVELRPLPKTEIIDDDYEPLEERDLYWYCNAWLIREGIQTIVKNMQSTDKCFIILKPKCFASKSLVRYKIVLRDSGKGLPSLARAFIPERGHLSKVLPLLQGFCELLIRSKIEGEEGIEYDAFFDSMDRPCPQMVKVGTEFVITITQRRDR